ncbi:3275_t:CDS:2, partial [Entrophospora sp. SA101]
MEKLLLPKPTPLYLKKVKEASKKILKVQPKLLVLDLNGTLVYNKTNTILIDDSYLKAAMQPFNIIQPARFHNKIKNDRELKKRDDRATTIEKMIRKEKNFYGFPRFKISIVEQCVTYTKATMSNSTRPFTERAWIGLKKKLIPEYDHMVISQRNKRQINERHLCHDVAFQTRQMDIPVFLFESSLIKYLPWLPSFRDPPFTNNDPRILWDEDFLQSIFIPRLRQQAIELKNNPLPISTVCGAFLHGGLANKRIFA